MRPFEVFAVILHDPGLTAVTLPEVDTLATLVLSEVHVTDWFADEGETEADRCPVSPSTRLSDDGVTDTDDAFGSETATRNMV